MQDKSPKRFDFPFCFFLFFFFFFSKELSNDYVHAVPMSIKGGGGQSHTHIVNASVDQ